MQIDRMPKSARSSAFMRSSVLLRLPKPNKCGTTNRRLLAQQSTPAQSRLNDENRRHPKIRGK